MKINQETSSNSLSNSNKYLTFWTDNQLFGISISNIVQIIKMQEITKIPNFPEYAKGIITIRGNVIPVIDVRIKLHKEEIDYNDKSCIIVANLQETPVGFIVDSINEVIKIEDDKISPPPKMTTNDTCLTGIAKINDKVILIIDLEHMFNNEESLSLINNIRN